LRSRGRARPIDAALRLIDQLTTEVHALDEELQAAFAGDKRIRQLSAIPGIGFTTAAVVLAEIGDLARFSSRRQAVQLGRTQPHRALERRARRTRARLEAGLALAALGRRGRVRGRVRHPKLREKERIASRRGTKIATVALARLILTLCSMRCGTTRAAGPSPHAHAPVPRGRPVQARSRSVMTSPRGRSLSG